MRRHDVIGQGHLAPFCSGESDQSERFQATFDIEKNYISTAANALMGYVGTFEAAI